MNIKKVILFIGIVLFVFVGCSKKKNDNEKKTYNVVEYTLAADKVVEGAPNIYLIVKKIDNSYFKVMFEAAKDASKKFNCNVFYSGSEDSSEWEAQEELMEIAKERGADAVIIAPDDTAKLVKKVSELYELGISVICVDAVVNTSNYNVCYMTNNLTAGEDAAIEMLKDLRAKGFDENENIKIAIQTGRSSSQSTNERIAGFSQYWTLRAPEKWEIISDIKANDGDSKKALSNTENFFATYSNIKGLFGATNSSTVGFANYISKNNVKDVVLVGFDYSKDTEALLKDDSYSVSVILQKQYDMAYLAIASAIDIKNNNFSMDSKFVDTRVTIVNNANINDPDIAKEIERN